MKGLIAALIFTIMAALRTLYVRYGSSGPMCRCIDDAGRLLMRAGWFVLWEAKVRIARETSRRQRPPIRRDLTRGGFAANHKSALKLMWSLHRGGNPRNTMGRQQNGWYLQTAFSDSLLRKFWFNLLKYVKFMSWQESAWHFNKSLSHLVQLTIDQHWIK